MDSMSPHDSLAVLLPVVTPFVFVFGACVGSFLNVVIWRLPRGESLWRPPSHCPKCNHAIRAYENIPILSWLMLRGRCSQCRLPISMQYPVIELATALLFVAVWWAVCRQRLPPTVLIGDFYLAGAALSAALIDVRHRRVPNAITYGGLIVAAAAALAFPAARGLATADILDLRPGQGFLTVALAERFLPALARWPRGLALADVAFGAAMGGGFLLAVRLMAVPLWGYRRGRLAAPAAVTLTPQGVEIQGAVSATWEEMTAAMSDRLLVWIENAEIEWAEGAPAEGRAVLPRGRVRLVVEDGWLKAGHKRIPLAHLRKVSGTTRAWARSVEVLGLGDVKLAAMIGALLGPDAMPFVLLLGGAVGLPCGLVVRAGVRGRRPGLPFAPFLAAGAVAWVLVGPDLLTAIMGQ